MNCPACGKLLSVVEVEPATVDVCKEGCGGIWFDRAELKKLDEAREGGGELLLELNQGKAVFRAERRRCPRCNPQHVLMTRLYHPTVHVQVEECPGCGGHFLDPGELGAIRSQAGSDIERKQAAGRIFQERFKVPMVMERIETQKEAEEVKDFGQLLNWIFPGIWQAR
jgi:Zn-finger nucleic acid-binding protein